MSRKLLCILLALFGWMSGAARAQPSLAPFEPDSYARILAQQKGKPFVLILWSLDCVYCQASLKALAQEKRRNKGLNIVTLATDPLGEAQSEALLRARLGALGLTAQAWAFGAASPEQLRYGIDPKWHGEMPRSYWFDARGVRLAYSGVLSEEVIRRLAAPAGASAVQARDAHDLPGDVLGR